MKKVVVLDNIRSVFNVGSIFRTADALSIDKIYLCGVTPTPTDRFGRPRADLAKVALGAQVDVAWEYVEKTADILKNLKKEKYQIIAIEQDKKSTDLKKVHLHTKFADFLDNKISTTSKKDLLNLKLIKKQYNAEFGVGVKVKSQVALVLGNEVEGINKKLLKLADTIVEIPMKGKKESLNVSVSFGIAGYQLFG